MRAAIDYECTEMFEERKDMNFSMIIKCFQEILYTKKATSQLLFFTVYLLIKLLPVHAKVHAELPQHLLLNPLQWLNQVWHLPEKNDRVDDR